MQVNVDLSDQSHEAKFEFLTTIGAKDGSFTPATVVWNAIELDGNPSPDLPEWSFRLNGQGAVTGTDLDDSYRRMISPFFFVYPSKPVAVGDKWEEKTGEKRAFTYQFESKGIERLANDDVMKISGTFKEVGGDMTGDGTWWVAKTGQVKRFESKVKGWTIAFDGGGEVPMDATIKGTLK